MKKDLIDLITVDDSLAVPVYKQIVQSIVKGINDGLIHQNGRLPSVNSIAGRFSLARGSVFSAYNELRASGIIDSIPGKGYFIASLQTQHSRKTLVLFDSFSGGREVLYDAILKTLPAEMKLDILSYNQNVDLFRSLIREKASYYNFFVVMPSANTATLSVLSPLDPKQVLLLDGGYKDHKKHFSGVYQNYEKDIYSLLSSHRGLTQKYKRLFLVSPDPAVYKDIVSGFKKFAKTEVIKSTVIHKIDTASIQRGDAFIVMDDEELVQLVNCAKASRLSVGRDIGVLSFRETMLKSAIADGISTMTPDYLAMAKSVVAMIASRDSEVIENPFILIDRKSF